MQIEHGSVEESLCNPGVAILKRSPIKILVVTFELQTQLATAELVVAEPPSGQIQELLRRGRCWHGQ